jgi:glutathione S-transferase
MLVIHARMLDPLSRALRVALAEKKAMVSVREVPAFEADAALLALEPEGRTPVLVDSAWGRKAPISEVFAAFEYVEELIPSPPLLPGGPLERAAARSLALRAARAFGPVVAVLVREKVAKRVLRRGAPDAAAIREATDEALLLIEQAGEAAQGHDWLTGPKMSLADIVAAAHISVLDYLDAISWDNAPLGRAWYARMKQRPSFRTLLFDQVPSLNAPPHYADLDF